MRRIVTPVPVLAAPAPSADGLNRALLPQGLRDVLPPECAHEHKAVADLLATFAGHGYDRVKPPLVEFEQNLLGGAGAGMANRTFRVMDPVSQRMLAIRADMTLQIARIATTRLKNLGRPLRLAYAGDVLRVMGSQLSPERQFTQAGLELIGTDAAEADAEVVAVAVESLGRLGIRPITVDLMLPRLVPSILAQHCIDGDRARALRQALDGKDIDAVRRLGGGAGEALVTLVASTGDVARVLPALDRLVPSPGATEALARLRRVVDLIRRTASDIRLTVDPIEARGFDYHSDLSFSLFAAGVRGELGRGGRYVAEDPTGDNESATGFTLYMDTVIRALPAAKPSPKLFVPYGSPADAGRRYRQEGWITVAGLAPADDASVEARRLGCTHVVTADGPGALDRDQR
jgi:ATP phosphoribosyltransferase regulatory subunit